MEEEELEELLQVEEVGRSRARWPHSSILEEVEVEEEVEVAEDRRGKEEPQKRSPSPSLG